MHRIIKAHLESFVKNFGLEAESEAVQFEKFCTYSVIASRFSATFDLDDVVTAENDDGIDGVAVVIDEEVCVAAEDAVVSFSSARRNHDVDLVFIQAKRSEGFDLGDFLKFKEGILRFIVHSPYVVGDDCLQSAHESFDVVLKNVPKIRSGRPSVVVRYVSTGIYRSADALETARIDFVIQLQELGLFADIDIKFIDREQLTALWVGTYSGIDASLDLFSNAPLPAIAGIDEAYLVVVKASDLVENLLTTPDGNLRTQVFEENVRSFLGLDNAVNRSISDTLKSGASASRFPVLNNGITIVSPDVRLQGNTLHLTNFQIVNGCQTSNVLFENRNLLGDVMVNVKVVETQNEDVFSELVRATNSQSKVDDVQFLSLKPINKRVEQYFNTYESDSRIFFERRDRQYVGLDIPTIRIFSLHTAAKCVSAMYCGRPELASRYPKAMYSELAEVIFADDAKEIVFYSACLALYRFNLLVSNNIIPQNVKRFKWHILALVRAIVGGKDLAPLNSKKAEKIAGAVVDVMAQHGPAATDVFLQAAAVCQQMGSVSADRLKRQAILAEMMALIR